MLYTIKYTYFRDKAHGNNSFDAIYIQLNEQFRTYLTQAYFYHINKHAPAYGISCFKLHLTDIENYVVEYM